MEARAIGTGARPWRPRGAALASIVGLVAALALYAVGAATAGVDPSNAWGIAYGTAAATLLVALALYAARRRRPFSAVARAHDWLRFHVWGGAFFLLLALMHGGFRVPEGPLNFFLFALSVWVSLSGLLGVALQKWIPRLLTSGLETEAVFERIPQLVGELRERGAAIAAKSSVEVREFYANHVAPRMGESRARLSHFLGAPSIAESRAREFEHLEGFVSPADKENVRALRAIFRAKLELDVQSTLQRTLRVWLYAHVPPSIALLALVALHVFNVFYY